MEQIIYNLEHGRKKLVFAVLFMAIGFLLFVTPVFAGNILSTNADRHAWSGGGDVAQFNGSGVIGWIDFYNGDSVTVNNSDLTGVANGLQIGQVALNCASAPVSNCGAPAGSWFVANDGNGNLSGWAWNDSIGWISFSGSGYQVIINPATGVFSGWAWNDVVGWISFNCNNSGIGDQCSSSNYRVATSWRGGPPGPNGGGPGGGGGGGSWDSNSWLMSSTFDTQSSDGAVFNTLSWQGVANSGRVAFRIATSKNPTGPWNFIGPDGSANSVYEPAGPNQQLSFAQAAALKRNHNNNRYMRYEIWLSWSGSQSPSVEDVIISYSP